MQTIKPGVAVEFSTFAEFLEQTSEEDRQFLTEEEQQRFAPAACGMTNGVGGWIVLGASWDEEEQQAAVEGLRSPSALRERLEGELSGGRAFSTAIPAVLHVLKDPAPLLLVQVFPVEWNFRPVCVGRDYARGTWRRVEGVNLLSGVRTRFRLGMDALERLRSDRPIVGMGLEALHEESVAAFREAVVERRPRWAGLSMRAFLNRAQVLSGDVVTQAGNCMLGRQGTRIRAELHSEATGGSEAFEVRNLWKACFDLMPRLVRSLSPTCAAAFRECFLNALIHADYDAGDVHILLKDGPASALIRNPGMVRTCRQGESVCRNFRLMKIFQLLGAAQGDGRGLSVIRRYQPGFRLQQDILELTTTALLNLEPVAALQDSSVSDTRPKPVRTPRRRKSAALSEKALPPEPEPPVEHAGEPPTGHAGKAPVGHTGEKSAVEAPLLLANWQVVPTSDPETLPVMERTPAEEAQAASPKEQLSLPFHEPVEERPAEPMPRAEDSLRDAGAVLSQGDTEDEPQRRQTSFGSAAEDLARSIAEMRGQEEQ